MNNMLLKSWVVLEAAVLTRIRRLKDEEHGAGVAEYAMVLGLAVLVGVAALTVFWGEIKTLFGKIGAVLQGVINSGG